MLPKVSAALSQFVTPIQTDGAGSSSREREFVRTQPRRERQDPRKHRNGGQPQKETAAPKQPAPPSPAEEIQDPAQRPHLASSGAFLNLLNSLTRGHQVMMRWVGAWSYRASIRAQKSSGRFSKGAMLDHRAE